MSQEDFYDHYETTVSLKKTSMTTMRKQYYHKKISMTTMRQQYVSRRALWPLWDNSTSHEDFYDHYETRVCLKKISMTTMR